MIHKSIEKKKNLKPHAECNVIADTRPVRLQTPPVTFTDVSTLLTSKSKQAERQNHPQNQEDFLLFRCAQNKKSSCEITS